MPILDGVEYEAEASVKLSGAGEDEAEQTINLVTAMINTVQNPGNARSATKGDGHLLASEMARITYLCSC